MKAETSFSLKDELFNSESVGRLTGWLSGAHPPLDAKRFQAEVLAAFPNLELKARINHISETLDEHLPGEYPEAVAVLVDALPPPLDPAKTDDDFGDFIIAPLSHYVARHGATEEHLDLSLQALREITKRFSAEDAIRTFINAFPERTMAYLQECAGDENYHVRRWASEGTRPKLPWSGKINIDHTVPLPILDALYGDPTRYVTRSVANHLNDIAKIDPELVVETLARWKNEGGQADPAEMAFIVEHSCRTLIKNGDRAALKLLGYGDKPSITISDLATSTPTVAVGAAFEFSFTLTAKKAQRLMVDYTMVFARDAGGPGGTKVFKVKRLEVEAGQTITIKKKHPMKLMTTRRLYEGAHTITLQVNGHALDSLSFNLVAG